MSDLTTVDKQKNHGDGENLHKGGKNPPEGGKKKVVVKTGV